MRALLHWNGHDLPDELKALPPGSYVIETVDGAVGEFIAAMTPEEDATLRELAAMDATDA